MNQALKYLLYSQAAFLFFIAICFLLKPSAFVNNAAISYYGTNPVTLAPYAAGMLLAAYFLLKSANHIKKPSGKILRLSLRTMAVLLTAMLLVPYSVNKTFSDVHLLLSGLLLLVVLATSVYIIAAIDKRPLNLAIAALELLGVAILYFSLFGGLNIHGPSELFLNLLFVALMYNTLKDADEHKIKKITDKNKQSAKH